MKEKVIKIALEKIKKPIDTAVKVMEKESQGILDGKGDYGNYVTAVSCLVDLFNVIIGFTWYGEEDESERWKKGQDE